MVEFSVTKLDFSQVLGCVFQGRSQQSGAQFPLSSLLLSDVTNENNFDFEQNSVGHNCPKSIPKLTTLFHALL